MKGIILAGGSGSRLYPLTKAVSKQMLPLYDKPMIYYPLSVLMLAEIQEILIISTPRDTPLFQELLGDGKWLGMNFKYKIQKTPKGLADAFIVGEDFIGKDCCAMILGDNVFYGRGFSRMLKETRDRVENMGGASIFGYYVKDPREYGVVEFDSENRVSSIEEKPTKPKSHYAVPGFYFYDNSVIDIAKKIQPSQRGEIEITSVNNAYLKQGKLFIQKLGRGMAWLDTGTVSGLMEASNLIETLQKRQGFYVSCIEEIAYVKKWISRKDLLNLSKANKSEYGEYLKYIVKSI